LFIVKVISNFSYNPTLLIGDVTTFEIDGVASKKFILQITLIMIK